MRQKLLKLLGGKIASNGFTMTELLVAMGVIAILAGGLVSVINPRGQFNKANDGQRKADLAKIQAALEQWRFDNASYPSEAQYPTNCGSSVSLALNGVTYLTTIPCDPSGVPYKYGLAATGNYCLRACLTNSADQSRDSVQYGADNQNSCGTTIPIANCSTGYSYTVFNQ